MASPLLSSLYLATSVTLMKSSSDPVTSSALLKTPSWLPTTYSLALRALRSLAPAELSVCALYILFSALSAW